MVPTSIFVILGCNHCVADIMYYLLAGDLNNIQELVETIVGNMLGACGTAWLLKTHSAL
jgi:formate/nitrite transporter FocA (FNT family)